MSVVECLCVSTSAGQTFTYSISFHLLVVYLLVKIIKLALFTFLLRGAFNRYMVAFIVLSVKQKVPLEHTPGNLDFIISFSTSIPNRSIGRSIEN